MSKIKDITGERFGRLVAEECVGVNKSGESLWRCKCDCGNSKIVPSGSLRQVLKCLQALNDAGLRIGEQELYQRLVTTTNKRLIKTDIFIDDCFDNLHFDGVTHNILVAKPWNVKLMQMFGEQYGNHHIVLCEDVNDIPQIVEQIREERRKWDIT